MLGPASIVSSVVLERIIAKKAWDKGIVHKKDEESTVMVKLEIYDARRTDSAHYDRYVFFGTQSPIDLFAAGTFIVSMQWFQSPPPGRYPKLSSLNSSYPAF